MGYEKSEFKMAVAHELGAGFDDALEQAQGETHKWAGAKVALGDAAIAVDALLSHIARDVKDEKMTIEESNAAQKWVRRAAEICRNLKLKAEVHEHRAYGQLDAYKKVVKITKTFYDKEKEKADALKAHEAAEAAGEPIEPVDEDPKRPKARPTGARPKNRVAERKRAEKTKAK